MTGVQTASRPASATELEVLERGEPPRRKLRYSVTPGRVQQLEVSMMAELEATSGERAAVALSHPVTLHVQVGPTTRPADGTIAYPIRLHDLTIQNADPLDPAQAERLRETLAPLVRVRGNFETTARGVARETSFQVPSDIPPRARALLGNLRTAVRPVPLPKDKLGKGAQWRTTRLVDLALVRARQTLGYRLTELQGQQGEVVLSITQSAKPQPLTNVAPEFEGRAQVYETSGVGAADFDLQSLAPVSAWVDITTRMRAEFEDASMASPLQFRVRSLLEMQRAPADDRPVGQRGSTNTERGSHRASTAPNSEN
jgi:hypothetical protein